MYAAKGTVEGDSALDREDVLKLARDPLERPVWALMEQLERTLRDLSRAEHFDLDDSTAVGAALHSALPQAFAAAELSKYGLTLEYCRSGPCYKIATRMLVGKAERDVSIELHHAGPQGGIGKARHQFASSDVDGAPELPGFAAIAPDTLLFFVAYGLDGARTSVSKLFLAFADGVDRKKVQLHRPEVMTVSDAASTTVANVGPLGTKLKVKEKARGEASEHVREISERRNAASGS